MATVSNFEGGRDNLEGGRNRLEGVVVQTESLQHHYHYSCNFCSASFTSELGLILHFRGKHYLNRGDEDDIWDDDDAEDDSQPEGEGAAHDELDFVTDYERALLAAESAFEPYSEPEEEGEEDEDLEADSEPEAEISWDVIVGPEHEDYNFWRGLPSSEKSGGGASHGNPQVPDEPPAPLSLSLPLPKKIAKSAKHKAPLLKRNSTSIPGGRRQLALRLLPLLHSPEKKGTKPPTLKWKGTNEKLTTPPTPKGTGTKTKDKDKLKPSVATATATAPVKTKTRVPDKNRESRDQEDAEDGGGHQLECIFCGKTYLWKYLLEVHFRSHTMERPYFCRLCEKSYSQQSHVIHHMRKYHAVEGFTYKCELCSQAFSTQVKWTNHQLKIHPGDLPKPVFKCELCDKTFPRQWDLARHRRVHSGEKGYKCKHCNSVFARSDKLLAHVRKLHS